MAHINRKILGSIKGRIGDVVFRERNGKVIVFSRPKKYKKTKSQKLKNERKKFATVVMLANIIKNSTDLYSIWKNSNLPGSNAYQKIIKNNLKLTNNVDLSINNILLPPGIDIQLNLLNTERSNNNITEIKLELEFENAHKSLFESATIYSLFYKIDNSPAQTNLERFHFNESKINQNKEDNKYIINIPVNIKLNKNCNLIGLFCVVSEKRNHKIYWTSTKGIKII